jgi:hypothetical protein
MTVLGGCGGWPAAGSACSGYLVEHGGFRVLIDPGYAVLPRLLGQVPADGVDALDRPGMLDQAFTLHSFDPGDRFAAGPDDLLPSRLPVLDAAVACAGAALSGAAALRRQRGGPAIDTVELDRGHVADAFRSERNVRVNGQPMGDGFAPLSRFWRAADGSATNGPGGSPSRRGCSPGARWWPANGSATHRGPGALPCQLLTPAELRYQVEDSGARILLYVRSDPAGLPVEHLIEAERQAFHDLLLASPAELIDEPVQPGDL